MAPHPALSKRSASSLKSTAAPAQPVKDDGGAKVEGLHLVSPLISQGNVRSADGLSHAQLVAAYKDLQACYREIFEEKDFLQGQIRDNHIAHNEEIKSLSEQVDELNNRIGKQRDKIDRVERVEQGIISLFIEMKDRSHEGDQPPNLEKEREEVRKLNPLVVLDYLRANLRTLLAFKEDYETELTSQLQRRKNEQEQYIDELHQKLKQMENERDVMKATIADAQGKIKSSEMNRRSSLTDAWKQMEDIQKELQRSIEVGKKKDKEIEALQDQARVLEEKLKHKEVKLMQVAQIENQVQTLELQHQNDIQKLGAKHQRILDMYEKEIAKFTKMEAEKKSIEDKAKKMETDMESMKNVMKRKQVHDLEKRVSQLQRMADRLEAQVKELEMHLRHTESSNQHLTQLNAQLKRDYDKLFVEYGRERGTRMKHEEEVARAVERGNLKMGAPAPPSDQTPYLMLVYKTKVKDKDKEIADLTNKVRRLMAQEQRARIRQRRDDLEDSQVAPALNRPASAGAAMETTPKNRAPSDVESLQQKVMSLEAQLANLKSVSTTAAHAYKRLLSNASVADPISQDEEQLLDETFDGGNIAINRDGSVVNLSRSSTHLSLNTAAVDSRRPSNSKVLHHTNSQRSLPTRRSAAGLSSRTASAPTL